MNKHKQTNTLTIVLVSFLAVILVVFAGLFVFNRWEVVIDLHEINEVHAQYGLPYEDPGVEAKYTGSIFKFYKKKADVTIDSSQVDLKKMGEYTVTYTAKYKDKTSKATRKVIVEDTIGPDIQLNSTPDAYTVYNHPYEEEGFQAIDNYDGDVTDKYNRKNPMDMYIIR
mgnify:FL=1